MTTLSRRGRAARRPDNSTDPGVREDRLGVLRSLLALSRPRQWPKNVLVISAPAAAGVLDQPSAMARTALMVLTFTAASAAVYGLNDVLDATADRAHPDKRHRPVASGALTPRIASAAAACTAVVSIAIAATLGLAAVGVIACYLAMSVAYTVRLKRVAVLEIVVVAAGFVLRALAGAVAVGVPASNWFLLVSLFGALYLVAGKRAGELSRASTSDVGPVTRSVLSQYPEQWLQQVVTVGLAGTMISYAMWAFQDAGTDVFTPLLALSVVPLFVALLRYGLLVAQGRGEQPDRLVLGDRPLLAAGAVWVLMVGVSIYLA